MTVKWAERSAGIGRQEIGKEEAPCGAPIT